MGCRYIHEWEYIEPGEKQRRQDNSYGKRRGGSHLIKSDHVFQKKKNLIICAPNAWLHYYLSCHYHIIFLSNSLSYHMSILSCAPKLFLVY